MAPAAFLESMNGFRAVFSRSWKIPSGSLVNVWGLQEVNVLRGRLFQPFRHRKFLSED